MVKKVFHEANRLSWNAATKRHNSHKGDQASALREGKLTLFPEDIELLGDANGKNILHLQCNAGQDTLSIAQKFNATVTGVDISDEAINFARQLSADSSIPATFYRSDVFDWLEANETQFDIIYMSYGTLVWLSDIKTWAKLMAKALKTGGRYVLMEFHPLPLIMERDWTFTYDYMGGGHVKWDDGVGDYVADSGGGLTPDGNPLKVSEPFRNPNPAHEFTWGLSDVITGLLEAGLTLKTFREYPYSNGWKPFPDMVEGENRRMYPPKDKPQGLPFMYGIVAEK